MKLQIEKSLKPKAIEQLRLVLTRYYFHFVANSIEIDIQETLPHVTHDNPILGFGEITGYFKQFLEDGYSLESAKSEMRNIMWKIARDYREKSSDIVLPRMGWELEKKAEELGVSLSPLEIKCECSIDKDYYHVPEDELNRILNLLVDFVDSGDKESLDIAMKQRAMEELRKICTKHFYRCISSNIRQDIREISTRTRGIPDLGFEFFTEAFNKDIEDGVSFENALQNARIRMYEYADDFLERSDNIFLSDIGKLLNGIINDKGIEICQDSIECEWSLKDRSYDVSDEELERILNEMVIFTE